MTNGPTGHETSLQAQMEQYALTRQGWVQEAADIVAHETGASIEDTFPFPMASPDEARRDSPAPILNSEEEVALREIAGRFGIGGERDVTLEDAGLPDGHVAFFEAGLVWKMKAESETETENTAASAYFYAGSPFVKATPREKEFQIERMGVASEEVRETQYEEARLVAESQPGYKALPEPVILPFGYTVDEERALIREKTGQFIKIGTRNDKPVILFRTDREDYIGVDDKGKPKPMYRYQPDQAEILGFVADMLTAEGNDQTAVGLVTSNTYSSRVIDAVRAGVNRGRQFGVAMFGRNTLATVKGEDAPEPTELMQIPGELRVAHFKLGQLLEEIQNPESN